MDEKRRRNLLRPDKDSITIKAGEKLKEICMRILLTCDKLPKYRVYYKIIKISDDDTVFNSQVDVLQ